MSHWIEPDWPLPFWIAHRGAGKQAPENTLAAFRLGAAHGWRAFECDVKLSADGVPYLLHDDRLERTTAATGSGDGLSWADLSQLDAGSWLSPRYAGEPPASLAGIATFLRANRYALDLEIKPMPGAETHTGQQVAAAVARLWGGDPQPPLLSSFQPLALQAARETAPQLARALLLDELWTGWQDAAQRLGCAAAITHHRWMNEQRVEELHRLGLRALVYTVNDAALAQRLQDAGVDGIISDAVHQLGPALNPPDTTG